MYSLNEQQIDFILGDINARGIRLESLQYDLLDHICVIIEQQLEKEEDFEQCYEATISTFYRQELREIEEMEDTVGYLGPYCGVFAISAIDPIGPFLNAG